VPTRHPNRAEPIANGERDGGREPTAQPHRLVSRASSWTGTVRKPEPVLLASCRKSGLGFAPYTSGYCGQAPGRTGFDRRTWAVEVMPKMTVSMRLMTAGKGYQYLHKSVAAADGARDLATPLTRYYLEAGCPPGHWLGAGLTAFTTDDARIVVGDLVTEEHLERLIGQGRHPLTGAQLGRAFDNDAAWKARSHTGPRKQARRTKKFEPGAPASGAPARAAGAEFGSAPAPAPQVLPDRYRAASGAVHEETGISGAVQRAGAPHHGAPAGAPTTADAPRSTDDAPGAPNNGGAAALVHRTTETESAPAVVHRRPVAGYDYTFSVPKSVSVLWGLADAGVQEQIVAVHHRAVAEVIAVMEREVVATRTGASTVRGGPVLHTPVDGVAATGFDHWDSRAGDPQLHTHVVISNKVHTTTDERWRAIDSRPMHHATVAISELYNAALADGMTRTFGLAWQQRQPAGRDRNPTWEITGIPAQLITEFSSRSASIDAEKDRLIEAYRQRTGHAPSTETIIRLRQQATLATRPEKQLRSLA